MDASASISPGPSGGHQSAMRDGSAVIQIVGLVADDSDQVDELWDDDFDSCYCRFYIRFFDFSDSGKEKTFKTVLSSGSSSQQ